MIHFAGWSAKRFGRMLPTITASLGLLMLELPSGKRAVLPMGFLSTYDLRVCPSSVRRAWIAASLLGFGVLRDGPPQRRTALASPLQGGRRRSGLPSRTPRLLATASASLVRLEIASRVLLRHQRHDADGEIVRLRQVNRGELDPAVPQRQEEGGVARQPVELGDDQRRSCDLGEVQRLLQLRPVRISPPLVQFRRVKPPEDL